MSSAPAKPEMEYRLLGNSGLKVSVLSFGSWVTFKNQLDSNAAFELMHAAFKSGINFFDNAETYADGKSETIMGETIRTGVSRGVWDRSDLVISTKIFFGTEVKKLNRIGLSRKHIVEGTIASLKRLQLDYVDLIFAHRPDPITPMEEVVRAFNHIIDRGWAFYWGTSEWDASQIIDACGIADRLGLIRPIMEQPEYNILQRERVEMEYGPLYKNYRLGLTTWSPLSSGILTGKYSQGKVPEGSRLGLEEYKWLQEIKFKENRWQIDKADELSVIAKELSCSLAQLSIAWCVKNKNVSTVILGASSVEQLQENISSLEVVPKLTTEIMSRIDEIAGTRPKLSKVQQTVYNMREVAKLDPR